MLGLYGKNKYMIVVVLHCPKIDYHSYNFVSYIYHLFSYISALRIMNETPDMCSINLQTQENL